MMGLRIEACSMSVPGRHPVSLAMAGHLHQEPSSALTVPNHTKPC
jgi:hypothetical protein